MKSVKEINDFMDRYRHMAINPQNTQAVNQFVFDTLIAITERLEALNPTPPARRATECDLCAYQANTQRAATVARREGMIKALRWVRNDRGPKYPVISRDTHQIDDAITRLEDGGEL